MQEFMMPSHGKGEIHCCKWLPEGEPRGVVQIVHGIAEYIARYDDLARFLTRQGFVVVGEDHMGHGGSISEETVQGYFFGGWEAAVADTHALYEKIRGEFPNVPYFIYGHSMGSFLTRTFLFTYPDAKLAGALISGTGWQPGLVLKAGTIVCNGQAKKVGADKVSPTVTKLMFGNYNKSYKDPKTSVDWLSRDEKEVQKYIADPLCGFDATVGLARDMLGGIKSIEKPENLAKMRKDLPVYFFSGDQDPVGNMGKGVRQSAAAFVKAGMKNVTVKLYEGGRHEMHNEINKDEVYQDVLKFLERNL